MRKPTNNAGNDRWQIVVGNPVAEMPDDGNPREPGGDAADQIGLEGIGVHDGDFMAANEPAEFENEEENPDQSKYPQQARQPERILARLGDRAVERKNVRLDAHCQEAIDEGPFGKQHNDGLISGSDIGDHVDQGQFSAAEFGGVIDVKDAALRGRRKDRIGQGPMHRQARIDAGDVQDHDARGLVCCRMMIRRLAMAGQE